jgi:hypothetical protein
MPSAAYFRRQADICLRLSLIASSDDVSSRLIAMAKEYMAASSALEPGGPASATPGSDEPLPATRQQGTFAGAPDPSSPRLDP